ncbi:thiosulfate oxidation carrier protein SoxY [Sulfurimonas sp. HSL-1716]|uniref:thiosulfate oxidation carrier protein SoxY n=1 Tax=Hydrocurvibacter sulfurireducens TaxID=3131937 RepID=UPI0031F83E03
MQRRKFLSLGALAAVAATVPATLSAEDFRKSKPDVWTAKTVEDAIAKLYGKNATKSDAVKLTTPDVASNGGQIPVSFKTDIDAKTVAVFQNVNPESAVIVYTIYPDSVIDYSIKMKMKKSGTITVVVEGKDGNLYSTSKTLSVALGGCEG